MKKNQLIINKGIIDIEFSKKFKNIPFRRSPIYEAIMENGYFYVFDEGAYMQGFLLDDNQKPVCGQVTLDTLNPPHNLIHYMWKGVSCDLFSSTSLDIIGRVLPGDTIRISLLSPNIIDFDKSIMNLGIKRYEKI